MYILRCAHLQPSPHFIHTSDSVRHIIESGHLTDLATHPVFSTRYFKAVPAKYRKLIPDYLKDYVSLNQFIA